jgi:hypothetical protein
VAKQLPPDVLEFFKKQGSLGGKTGGKKRWEGVSAEERSEHARKAVRAREEKRAAKTKKKVKRGVS